VRTPGWCATRRPWPGGRSRRCLRAGIPRARPRGGCAGCVGRSGSRSAARSGSRIRTP